MPRQSNGTYQAPGGTTAVSNTTISSVAFNSLETDIGSEVTNSLDRLGRSAMEAALPMGGFQINNMAAGVLGTDATNLAQVEAGVPLAQVAITGAVATVRPLKFQTSGANRWFFEANATAESGSNVGSDFVIYGLADDGVTQIPVATITRATGVAAFAAQPAGLGLVGMIASFPVNAAPAGWLECNGGLVSRATYPLLWAFANSAGTMIVSDATWTGGAGLYDGSFSMGDGSTTFRLPDLRGNFLRGWDHSRGVDSGRGAGLMQTDAVGPHIHPLTGSFGSVISPSASTPFFGNGGSTNTGNPNAAAGVATENRPRNAAVMICIKF